MILEFWKFFLKPLNESVAVKSDFMVKKAPKLEVSMRALYRSEDGVIAGVCKGLSEILEIEVGLIRLAFLAFLLIGGSGIVGYFALVFALPRKDKLPQALEPKILGVCANLAKKTEIDVGIIRFFTILSLFGSIGLSLLFYIILKIILSESESNLKDLN